MMPVSSNIVSGSKYMFGLQTFSLRHKSADPAWKLLKPCANRCLSDMRLVELVANYFERSLSIAAQACATPELGSVLPGKVAQPPWLM